MQVKTFTALITIAVNGSEIMPHEFALQSRLMASLEGKHTPTTALAQAAHVSVLQGDCLMEPDLCPRAADSRWPTKLSALGQSLQMVKDQHGLLHRRSVDETSIPHPTLNEGSGPD